MAAGVVFLAKFLKTVSCTFPSHKIGIFKSECGSIDVESPMPRIRCISDVGDSELLGTFFALILSNVAGAFSRLKSSMG
jgi:hypothetical protein